MAKPALRAEVTGLKELRRTLLTADKKYGSELRKILKDTAMIIADDARRDVPVLTGRAQSSLRGGASGPGAMVVAGSKKVPYYGWLDFGGTISPKGNEIVRTFIKSGRFIVPAVKRKLPEAIKHLEQKLVELIIKGASS